MEVYLIMMTSASETPGNVKRVHVFSSHNINGALLSKPIKSKQPHPARSEIKVQKLSLGWYLFKRYTFVPIRFKYVHFKY